MLPDLTLKRTQDSNGIKIDRDLQKVLNKKDEDELINLILMWIVSNNISLTNKYWKIDMLSIEHLFEVFNYQKIVSFLGIINGFIESHNKFMILKVRFASYFFVTNYFHNSSIKILLNFLIKPIFILKMHSNENINYEQTNNPSSVYL